MMNFDRKFKFKDLHNALELAVNADGIDRTNTQFDNRANELTGISTIQLEKWRHLYMVSLNRRPALCRFLPPDSSHVLCRSFEHIVRNI
jgi:hypothetical protein